MGKPGRPIKYTQEIREQITAQIVAKMQEGFSLTAACGSVGLPRQCIYDWQNEDPSILYDINIGRAGRLYKLEEDLLTSTEGPRVTARIFACKNACPEEWVTPEKHEFSGPDGKPIQTEEVGAGAAKLAAFLAGIADRSE
jgi:hypothetical protein